MKDLLLTGLDDLLRRFAAPAVEEDDDERIIKGTALGMAQDWLVRLPEGPARTRAICALADAMDLALVALDPN